GLDIVQGFVGLGNRVAEVSRLRVDDAGRAGDEEGHVRAVRQGHGPRELGALEAVRPRVVVCRCLTRILERLGDDVVAIGGKGNRPGREIAALGSDARTCRKDRTTSCLPLVASQEGYVLVEIGPGAVQLLVAL